MTTATVKAELLALEQERRRALVQEDYPRVAQLFADDLVYVHTTGLVQGKLAYLEYAKNAGEPQGYPAFFSVKRFKRCGRLRFRQSSLRCNDPR